ncbi:hypothetical protein U1Q18_013323, partial [Sarracenia purpurea var. burkii]
MAGPLLRSLWSFAGNSISSSSSCFTQSTVLKPYIYACGLTRPFSMAAGAVASSADSGGALEPTQLRNVAVIAHVDHGKTTLMDRLLRPCDADIPHERAMDYISLKRERGITISSKVRNSRCLSPKPLCLFAGKMNGKVNDREIRHYYFTHNWFSVFSSTYCDARVTIC